MSEQDELLRSKSHSAKVVRRRVPHSTRDDTEPLLDDAGEDHYQPFRQVSENRPSPPMLSMRHKTGLELARSYSDLREVTFDGQSIAMKFVQDQIILVTVSGRNLRELFRLLALHKVSWLAEIDELHEEQLGRAESEPAVYSITSQRQPWET